MYIVLEFGAFMRGVEMGGSESALNMLMRCFYAWSGNGGVRITLSIYMVNRCFTYG